MPSMQVLDSLFGLSGKSTLVTGAGSGIGKATSKLFAQVGASVVLVDRDLKAAQDVADMILSEGGDATAIRCEISNRDEVFELFESVTATNHRIDILVNNAAVHDRCAWDEVTPEVLDRIHGVNLHGVLYCMQAMMRMLQRQEGPARIINVSSISSVHPSTFDNAVYASAKAGVNALTRSAALELAHRGVTVNAVLPGPVDTNAAAALRARGITVRGPSVTPGRRLMGRKGDPIEIAAAILFLASPAASYITGQCLIADGGFLIS